MLRKFEIDLEYQNYIKGPPRGETEMYAQACGNDKITMDSWREIWIKNITSSHKRFGSFKDNACQSLVHEFKHRPVIIAGSGPSLKVNAKLLKERGDIGLISCLHNKGYFDDIGVVPDYYMSLDAGKIVIPEATQGGKEDAQVYWDKSKDQKLLAYIGSDPNLFDKWQGKVHLFNCPVGDPAVQVLTDGDKALEVFAGYISTGGNALGASMYFAKAVMGANPVIFVGADFAFGHDKKFHAWDSPYDKQHQGGFWWPSVYSQLKCFTWNSYFNFKTWVETVAVWRSPGIFINATEGGILGSYNEGNIEQIQQMSLANVLARYLHYSKVDPSTKSSAADCLLYPEKGTKLVLF